MKTRRPPIVPDEITVLVHGLWMHGAVMRAMGRMLEAHGFRTYSLSYDFLNRSPEENAQQLYRKIGELGARRVNLVGHSLGGIVVLHLLHQYPHDGIGKIVLIGSPVRGSSVARRVYQNRALRGFLGRSVEKGLLGGAPKFDANLPLGIITGSGGLALTALLYPAGAESDGVVLQSETLIDQAMDRITIEKSHSTLIFSRRCAELVANFLTYGRFRV
ncbi:MAG: alpha/beta fold hydrolase [Granulosicoccus sp.]|nr:alpha/beta fold hydrolase [Granulosicoccus sp.]